MKKSYATPRVVVHGTVEDITQSTTLSRIFGYPGYGHGGDHGGGHGGGHPTGS